MSISTFEGYVEKGQVRLKTGIHLPDNTKVYVIVPDFEIGPTAHIYTPRLVHSEQSIDLKLEIIEEPDDARV